MSDAVSGAGRRAGQDAVAAPPARDRRTLSLMAAGHLCADLAQGSVPALVPFLAGGWDGVDGIGYGRAGVLLLVMALTSSVVQPLIGAWADRGSARWPVPFGVLLAGLGIAALGQVAGSYPLMLVTVAVAGLGVALFHPDGARRATVAAGPRAAGGLGLFAVGGSAGFALAPALLTPAVLAWGLPGTAVVLLPALAVAAALTVTLEPRAAASAPDDAATERNAALPANRAAEDRPAPSTDRAAADGDVDHAGAAPGARDAAGPQDRPREFALVVVLASLRSGAYFAAQALLAVAVAARLDLSIGTANALLTVMLAAGIAGTLVGGVVADRIGNRRAIAAFQGAVVPTLVLVQVTPSLATAGVAAAALGVAVTGAYSPTIVTGQRLMPNRQRLAAGMTVGLAIGVGGVAASVLGAVADATGPVTALWAVAIFGAAGALMAPRLPDA